MKKQSIKLLEYNYPEGLDNGEFVLQIRDKTYRIRDVLIFNNNAPEGNCYYEVKPHSEILIYKNCKKTQATPYKDERYELLNAVLGIGTIATVARKLQGYEIEETGRFFNAFINDDGDKQAIVYPYPEMAWGQFKQSHEAYREKIHFERVKKELLERGFAQNEKGFWVQKQ